MRKDELHRRAQSTAGWTDIEIRIAAIKELMRKEYRRGYRAAKKRTRRANDKNR